MSREEQQAAEQGAQIVSMSAGRFDLILSKKMLLGLEKLNGIGPKSAKVLRERGILDQKDLVLFLPRKYRRVGHYLPGPQMVFERVGHVEFIAPVQHVRLPAPSSRQPLSVTVQCDGQLIKLIWFGGMTKSSMLRGLEPGLWLHVSGSVSYDRSVPEMSHPTINVLTQANPLLPQAHFSIEPVYRSIEGVKDAMLRRAQLQALESLLPHIGDILPERVVASHDLPPLSQALRTLHVIEPQTDLEEFLAQRRRAKRRLIYEEFYTLQLKLARDYASSRAVASAPQLTELELGRELLRQLPFQLTGDQRKALATIAEELSSRYPMRRLLQGDVGSGKTIVAFCAAAMAVGSGQQVALMAPTDILARQHVARAEEFFAGLKLPVCFLGGSLNAADKREALSQIASGEAKLVIGTHALIQPDVTFEELGLVMIDEQHKFGVEQRDALLDKGEDPHLLSMTATPIPRSLAHAIYGDLDLLLIREKPPGRQPVRTILRDVTRAPRAYDYIRERVLREREQVYFVYPMIEASEAVANRKNVTEAVEHLREHHFEGLRLEVLHGRLHGEQKAEIMARFADGQIDVLCATTVIEVGLDVANATIMVIESPEVFGLSQLHQLRGRVGRGSAASMCILLADRHAQSDSMERLVSFSETEDGFELAEIDLRMRGPGLFLGARQAGLPEFKFGDLERDKEWLLKARADARLEVLGEGAARDDL